MVEPIGSQTRRYVLRDDQWQDKGFRPDVKGMSGYGQRIRCSLKRGSTVIGPASLGGTRPNALATHQHRYALLALASRAACGRCSFQDAEAHVEQMSAAMIHSTIVRAHQHSPGAQKKMAEARPSGAARRAEHQQFTRLSMRWAIRWTSS